MKNLLICNKMCDTCKHLNTKVDSKGYPWGYDCLKYHDSVFYDSFHNSKYFTQR